MPAEGERHRRTWLCWPCRQEAWDGPAGLDAARAATAEVARAVARHEPVILAHPPGAAGLPEAANIELWEAPLDDSWARDIGPTFVTGPDGPAAIAWRFNAWGGKYAPFDRDAAFAARLGEKAGVPVHPASIVCEGGAIHSDGQGTLLTTRQCVLNPNRNPGLTAPVAEEVFRYALGARRVLWLDGVFSDTETDGHIDNIACFVAPGRVLVGMPAHRGHPDWAPVRAAIAHLKEEGMEVVELSQPQTVRRDGKGKLLQTSYVNFYLCNGGLVMPSFDDAQDEKARATLADCFADRAISMVPALAIVAGGGGIHCITQQEPA